MSFKAHLLIVSAIILVVYLVWDWNHSGPAPSVASVVQSPYTITVNHASWGLNCPVFATANNVLDKAYVKKSGGDASHPTTDNALQIVSSICNGSPDCGIALADDTFPGMAPATCQDKKLEVEYRCFSYDRPWHAEAMSSTGALVISCSDKVPQ